MNEASTLEVNRTVQPWPSITGGISPGPRHWNRFLVESQSGACWNTGAGVVRDATIPQTGQP